MTGDGEENSVLRDTGRRYQVGFRVLPDYVTIKGRVVEVTFHLTLRGTDGSHEQHAGSLCRTCIRVLTALFEIADALVPVEREALKRIGQDCEKRVHYSRDCNGHCAVTLVCTIKARREFERATDGWAMDFVQELTGSLLAHGCEEVDLTPEAGRQTFLIEELDPALPAPVA